MPDDAATGRAENPLPAGYPARWAADVVLADGATVHVRPIRPDDGPRIHAFHARQSPESIYFRYFSPHPTLSEDEVERLVNVDYQDRMAFVALRDEDMIGVARYDRWPTRSEAEVAFFVDDAHRGRGIATLLLEYLSVAAREVGISAFTATVLPSNRRMVAVFQQAGFEVSSSFEEGVIEVRLGLQPTPEAEAAIEARAQQAAARAVQLLMAPRSVAVIGASRDRGSVGHEVLRNVVGHEFAGPVYPVNRALAEEEPGIGAHVAGVPAVRSVADIPGRVDLAVVCVPAAEVPAVLEECGRHDVRAAIVISAGFAEVGGEGVALSDATLRVARRFGIRLLGPNCLGVINTDPRVRLHATFATPQPLRGKVALLAESGTIGGVVIDHMDEVGLGISSFAAIGNRADVSANDLLQYWAGDARTEAVLLNLESFGNPRNFSRIARQLARTKPVVAVKSGRAARAYPGDGDDELPADTAGALLRQTGIIRVDTLGELLDVARVLGTIPQLPAGPRVAVVGNAGGSLVTAADACVDAGLALAEPEGVRRLMRKIASTKLCDNPFDLGYLAPGRDLEKLLRAALKDDDVDSVLVVCAPSPRLGAEECARVIEAARPAAPDKPLVACIFGPHPPIVARPLREAGGAGWPRAVPDEGPGGSGGSGGAGGSGDGRAPGVAVFDFPDAAAYALGKVTRYALWRAEPEGWIVEPEGASPTDARRAAADALDAYGEGWLGPTVTGDLLRAVGIEPIPTQVVDDVDAAVAAADELGYPVAVKALSRDRLAKSEAAGLALDVQGDDDLRATCARMVAARGAEAFFPAIVQPMASPGVDVAVSVVSHPLVGPVLTLSAGGVATPVAEARVQVLPLTDLDAQRCVAGSPVGGLLDAVSRYHLEDLLLRVGALVEAAPEVDALELNPVILSPSGAAIADARIRVAPTTRDAIPPVRRL